jgi:hypothetical protein
MQASDACRDKIAVSVTGNAAGNYAAPVAAKALGKREKLIALGIVRRAA